MNLTKLKQLIFEYESFVWNDRFPDKSAYKLQTHAEYYLCSAINSGMSYEKAEQLLIELIKEQGYPYPLVPPGSIMSW